MIDFRRRQGKELIWEQLLDINPEGELLGEIKDIQVELHVVTKVYPEQQTVIKACRKIEIYLDQNRTNLSKSSSLNILSSETVGTSSL